MTRERVEAYYFNLIQTMIAIEIPIAHAREHNRKTFGAGAKEATWLLPYKFIGTADRSILNTIKFVQSLSNIIRERHYNLISRKGIFGKAWNETRAGLAKRIVQDMDDLLMAEIMPILINICCSRIWQNLPHEDELLPLFTLLRNYVKEPEKPISWALAFAVHTIVTSIFEVQGSDDVHDIAEVAESSFNLYFEQLSIVSKASHRSQPQYWAENVKKLQILKMLIEPPTLKPSREQTLRGLWNPFCAGNFLGYIAYFSNLEEGSWMVDSFSQLRMVLHLHNALKDVGLAPADDQGLFELLDMSFEKSKAVWEGPKPTRGNFVQRWWIVFGANVKEARRLSDQAAARFGKAQNASSNQISRPRLQGTTRRMTPIEPDKLSKSYRRIMNRDFSDVVDKYHKTAEEKSNPLYDHAVRCNDTMDAIFEDQTYLAINMTALGAHLNNFIDEFFNHYWKKEIQMIARTTPDSVHVRRVDRQSWETSDENLERQAMVCIFAEEILGRLDFLDLSKPNSVVVQAMSFMTFFFHQFDPELIMYFTPVEGKKNDLTIEPVVVP